MMGKFKFKKGDKVKLSAGHRMATWGRQEGETGVVTEDDSAPFVLWDRDGQKWAASEEELELVSPVWVPKVGDRVKYKNPKFGEATVLCMEGNNHVKVDTDGIWGICTESIADLLPSPTTLTIEPGRYYKTRDGRKVGPLSRLGDFWEAEGRDANGTPGHFADDGISAFRGKLPRDEFRLHHDLIAEWQEPAVVVSAQVDALAEEYGPAKVAPPWRRYAIPEPVEVAANDNNSSDLVITIDTSQTQTALDEIIRKLKKIRRLSAELGIDLAA